jgi:hypothetical protein
MTDSLPTNQAKQVSLDPALVPLLCATLLYAVSWIIGCSSPATAGKSFSAKNAEAREQLRFASDDASEKLATSMSGRKLTIEKMAQRAVTSLQFSNEEYGVAFDAPKGYLLKEGELPEMDRGLGYLGPVPMHFTQEGGVRLATVEPPTGVLLGTNFVNEFFTMSALYNSTAASCSVLDIAPEFRGAPVTRTVDSIVFHGTEEAAVASMHQYTGIYLHGFANETCYEIGYGVATIGDGPARNLKRVDPQKLTSRLEKILDTVRIAPPNFERFTATE